MDHSTKYRLHLGVRITQRVLWTLITDAEDNPVMNFPNVEAAVHWLHNKGETCVIWRSGNYTGTLTLGYEPDAESDILYHIGTPKQQVQEVLNGEGNGTSPLVRSKRLSSKIHGVRKLERD